MQAEYPFYVNACGIDFDDYKLYSMLIKGDRDTCILAAENRGVNIINWRKEIYGCYFIYGYLPSVAALNRWFCEGGKDAAGEYAAGTLLLFTELDKLDGTVKDKEQIVCVGEQS